MKKIRTKSKKLDLKLKTNNCKIHKATFLQADCPFCKHSLMNDDWE